MKLPRLGQGWMRSRRLIRSLESLAESQLRIADALDRIADRIDPIVPDATPEELAKTDNSYATDQTQARIQEYVERVWKDTGRAPTDDEVVRYLEGEP